MRCDARGGGTFADRGTVTAELAACLPVLVLVVATAVSAVTVAGARVRAQDAAREAARAAARGDDRTAAWLAQQAAPGATLRLTRGGELVTAAVSSVVHPFASWLPGFTVVADASAAAEQ